MIIEEINAYYDTTILKQKYIITFWPPSLKKPCVSQSEFRKSPMSSGVCLEGADLSLQHSAGCGQKFSRGQDKNAEQFSSSFEVKSWQYDFISFIRASSIP